MIYTGERPLTGKVKSRTTVTANLTVTGTGGVIPPLFPVTRDIKGSVRSSLSGVADLSVSFNPLSIGGCVLWLDATKITGLSDADPVASWLDASGEGNDGSAASTARPTYKTNIQNGHPVVRFTNPNHIDTASFSQAQPLTYFIVMKTTTWQNTSRIIDGLGTDEVVLIQLGSEPQMQVYAGSSFVATNGDLATGAWGIVQVTFDGASSEVSVDGGTATTGNPGSGGISGGLTIGSKHDQSTGSFEGDMGEILAYDLSAVTGDPADVLAYLQTKWNTP